MKILFYDCEIKNAIPVSGLPPVPGLKYCAGWHDFANMGISFIGCWWRDEVFTFDQSGFSVFQEFVNDADLIVGFNSVAFDDKLCAANGIDVTTSYDLLREVRFAAGMPPHYVRGVTRAGYSLDSLALTNLGVDKSGRIASAALWQMDNTPALCDYLITDIWLIKALFDMRSVLVDPTNGCRLRLREPWS